jgi:hypothetical protein
LAISNDRPTVSLAYGDQNPRLEHPVSYPVVCCLMVEPSGPRSQNGDEGPGPGPCVTGLWPLGRGGRLK